MRSPEKDFSPYQVSCSVLSRTHRLNKQDFSIFMTGQTNVSISDVRERSFVLTCTNTTCDTLEQFLLVAHLTLSCFLMALNISTLGNFTWDIDVSRLGLYTVFDAKNRRVMKFGKVERLNRVETKLQTLSQAQIDRLVLLFPTLSSESDSEERKEYIKGILHLSLNFYDIDFRR